MKENNEDRPQKPGARQYLTAAVLVLAVLLLGGVVLMRLLNGEIVLPSSPSPKPTAVSSPGSDPKPGEPTPTPQPTDALSLLTALHAENEDAVGWIRIEGTRVDDPVMFNQEDPEFYLTRGADGEENVAGALFIDEGCSVEPRSANLLIHGHNMLNGSRFHDLLAYKDKEYFDEHPVVEYTTLEGTETYEILAVFLSRVFGEDETYVFRYYRFYDAANSQEFDNYVESCKASALYETGVTAQYGDELLTLSTCEYTRIDGRLVVVARHAAGTEDETKTEAEAETETTA